jgi:hypothetical protein
MRIEAASDAQPKTQTTLNGLGNQTSALLRHSNSSVLMNGIDEQVDITSRLGSFFLNKFTLQLQANIKG